MKKIILILSMLISAKTINAQEKINFKGTILDKKGEKLAFVNVFFKDGDYAGDVSNDSGFFEIKTSVAGERTLVASLIGYETFQKKIQLPHETAFEIALEEKSLDLKEITIEASAYTGGEGKVTLNKIDVYTTPGGAADIFQSIKVLPGVVQSDETAALPIRGGSPSENLIMINQATLSHPYHSENTAGNGLFTIVETAVMKRLYFSSGGFSVKYGNALSGVLDIETENRIQQNRLNLDLNMVAAGGGLQRVLNDKVNVQLYGKKTTTDILFKFNKPSFDVVEDPTSSNITGIVNYNYSKTGLIQFFGLYSDDAQKFDLTLQSNKSRYELTSSNQVAGLLWSDVVRKSWFSKTAVSFSGYNNRWEFSDWYRDNYEYNMKLRWDNTLEINSKMILLFGSEGYLDRYDMNFLLPKRRNEFYAGADSVRIRSNDHSLVQGNYVEMQNKLSRLWSLSMGIREDYHSLSQSLTADIRGSVANEIASNTFLRLSAGTFHQYPAITLYDKNSGNPDLKPMRAIHTVVGYEKIADPIQLKIEGYYKWYAKLPLEDEQKNYTSKGRGFARGVDVFFKGVLGRTSGWISYSFIQTQRSELDVLNRRPTIYDITNNIKIVQKTRLGKGFEWSSTARYASGRPFTPVESGVYDGQYWTPVYAAKNSGRFPAFKRFDSRISKLFFFGERKYVVVYIEGLNVFGFKNILDYSYSENFAQRSEVKSYFSNRTVVIGFSASL